MPHDKKLAGEWSVFDMNAREHDMDTGEIKPRIHDAAPGHRYKLTCDKPCFMPQGHARVFLKDPAFRVLDADDKEVASLNKELLSRKPPERLEDDQVLANVNELTDSALLTRATQRPGGARFSDQTRRQVLVDFLIEGHGAIDTSDDSLPPDGETGGGYNPPPLDTSLTGS